ncbi:MAG: TonB-dependent siderophore receptor [Rhizonema sp. PD37]|nr:TonB-dependent siderophore receptor [Rhizonema sp. PD37]
MLKLKQIGYFFGIVGAISVLTTVPARAEMEQILARVDTVARDMQPIANSTKVGLFKADQVIAPRNTRVKNQVPITEIPQISDIPRPHTSVKDLLGKAEGRRQKAEGNSDSCSLPVTAGNKGLRSPLNGSSVARVQTGSESPSERNLQQSSLCLLPSLLTQETQQNQVTQVTGVRLNRTKSGLEIILEVRTSDKLQTKIKIEGNNFVADIPNAQVRLTSGNSFRQDNPVSGITVVTVSNHDTNSIQVTVKGKAGAPTVNLFDSNEGLIFGVTTVASSTQQQQPQTSRTQEPINKTPQTQPSDRTNEPIELVVTGERESRYSVPSASTATKIEVPLSSIPQSIQVIPSQLIEDRQAVRLSEVGENVSGVLPRPGYGGLSSVGFYIRGFNQRTENFRNGFRDYGFLSPREVANVERVEFLKGPGSVLYGGGTFGVGGVVNTVTKKPLDQPYYEANLTIGNYDFYRPTIDLTGPLVSDRSLSYRLNLAYENAGSFRDFNSNENVFVAPALSWQIDSRTKLSTEFEHQHDQFVSDFGFPFERESLRLPRNRFLGVPGFNNADVEANSFTYNFEHKFNDNWRFRQGFNAILANGDIHAIYFNSLQDDRQTLERSASKSHEEQENYSLQNEIFGKFNTGALHHNVLVGVELARYRYSYDFLTASVDPINIFNPKYDALIGNFTPDSAQKYGSDNLGIYLQDLIDLLPNLKLLAGGRLDLNDSSYDDLRTNRTLNEQSNSHFSPRVGIVYQPTDSTSVYFSWSNSFNPQFTGRSRTDQQFKPETGEQFEVGVKQQFLNNRLSGTLAFYQLTRQNVLTPDPVDRMFSIQTGEQRSRGIELDIAGQVLPGWNIIATYAYTDAVITKDNVIPVGDRLDNAPQHSASLWTTYEIQKGNLHGLGFGAGLYYVGERQAELPNAFKLPNYVRTDVAVFYRRDNYKVALNIKNLFGVNYYQVGGDGLLPGAPLIVLGTVSFQF